MSAPKNTLSRRQFVRWGVLGAMAWTAAACGKLPQSSSEPDVVPTSTATPAPATLEPTRAITLTQALKILRNENRKGFYIRYFKPFPAVDASAWRLEVAGLVENPRAFSLTDLLALPQVTLDARMKCVECWSVRAQWGGFAYQSLAVVSMPAIILAFKFLKSAGPTWLNTIMVNFGIVKPANMSPVLTYVM